MHLDVFGLVNSMLSSYYHVISRELEIEFLCEFLCNFKMYILTHSHWTI